MDGGDGMTEAVIVAVQRILATKAGSSYANKTSPALID